MRRRPEGGISDGTRIATWSLVMQQLYYRDDDNKQTNKQTKNNQVGMIWLVMTTNKGGGHFKRHANVDLNVGDNDKKLVSPGW